MAAILDVFVSKCLEKIVDCIEEKAAVVLGVKEELVRLQGRLERIQKVLQDAERRRLEDAAISHWVNELKDVVYDADDIIDLCRIHGAGLLMEDGDDEGVNPPGSPFRPRLCRCFSDLFACFAGIPFSYKIGTRIKNLNRRLQEIAEDKSNFGLEHTSSRTDQITTVDKRQTSSMVDVDVIVGREIEDATNKLVNLILGGDLESNCCVFAVTGMGGVGKTTLAQKIFNHQWIRAEFQKKVWVCVSHTYSETDLLQQVIRAAGGTYGDGRTKAELQPMLGSVVMGRSFFLVLDDVWRADVWIDLLRTPLSSAGSAMGRILITTRDENVAKQVGSVHIHQVTQLPVETGWEMLYRRLLVMGKEEEIRSLKEIGTQIVKKCSGLPLAIKSIAGVLARKDLSEAEWVKVLKNEAWSMAKLPDELRGALYLSYDDLPSPLKQCFLYCSLWPEDWTFHRDDLIRMWVAEGFILEQEDDSLMEDTAREYYKELIRMNLLQADPLDYGFHKCKMHDLLRSLALFLSKDEILHGDTSARIHIRRVSIMHPAQFGARILDATVASGRLRTLLCSREVSSFNKIKFEQLACLRVLQINDADFGGVADGLGELVHLRYLDFDRTDLKELPESIWRLTNLQFLNLCGCRFLKAIPRTITKLRRLRRLGLEGTCLDYIPKGIRRLAELNDLSGFVVGDNNCMNSVRSRGFCCTLEELSSLAKLRVLRLYRLERAQAGDFEVRKLTHLKELRLFFTISADYETDELLCTEENIKQVELLLEDMHPPQSLELLHIVNYFGSDFPRWLMSPSLGRHLPNLTYFYLEENISCTQVPSLGLLPNLRILSIYGASSIESIGPQFFGSDLEKGMHVRTRTRTAFPKLELLKFRFMPKLEEWISSMEEQDVGEKLLLWPCLVELVLEECPSLKALPDGLQFAPLNSLSIVRSHEIKEVCRLPLLGSRLMLRRNLSLERVSNLPELRVLEISECPSLRQVEDMKSLLQLDLDDGSMESLRNGCQDYFNSVEK
ncbi:hypothetical protein HPP92_013769 [Vanilla planifolia]|uniref:Disease resistance protein RGA3 n=1 Tax=Vanilla planifolia TaxID=51239 RepID=A0A835PCW1_VANPL|nr:hypothetical protein HPP92_026492 [Vanilla planifolia]KAG0479050.1 hypothetical protein HPP92_013769 [Vanilla planifolia]